MDKVFLKIHDMYFSVCGQVQDPPLTTLIMLIAPITIATLLLPLLCVNLTTRDTETPSTLGFWCAKLSIFLIIVAILTVAHANFSRANSVAEKLVNVDCGKRTYISSF